MVPRFYTGPAPGAWYRSNLSTDAPGRCSRTELACHLKRPTRRDSGRGRADDSALPLPVDDRGGHRLGLSTDLPHLHSESRTGDAAATVSACLIVRDCATRLAPCLASVRPYVDEVCVYDTGSVDGTLALLERLAEEPGAPIRFERGEWRDSFAWARQRSFELATHPWRIYLDDDDLLIGGASLHSVVAAAAAQHCSAVSVAYDHHDQPDGTRIWVWTNRILHRDSGRWEGAVHELWRGLRVEEIAVAHPGALHVRHLRRLERPGHYRRLVELSAADLEHTPRGLMMLGFELLQSNDEGAIRTLEAYLHGRYDAIEGEPNGFRFIVLEQLAKAYRRTNDQAAAATTEALRDAYALEITRAVETGRIEDVEFWRRLSAETEALAAQSDSPPLLPGPATAIGPMAPAG